MTTSKQLERQAEETRADIVKSIELLRARMTAGQIVDRTLDFAREGRAGQFVRNLGQEVAENPVPAMLIAAGVGWLMMGNRQPRRDGFDEGVAQAADATWRAAHTGTGAVSDAAGSAADFANEMAQRAGETAEEWAARARRTLDDLAQRSGETGEAWAERTRGMAKGMARQAGETSEQWVSRIRRTFDDMAQRTGETAEQWAERTRSAASGLMERARAVASDLRGTVGSAGEMAASRFGDAAHAASEAGGAAASGAKRAARVIGRSAATAGSGAANAAGSIAHFLKEEPLVLAGIGVALGAAIGAAFPSTEIEDEYMGEASDALKNRATEVADRQWKEGSAAVQDVAGAALKGAKEAAAEHGLMPDNNGDQPSLIPDDAGFPSEHEAKSGDPVQGARGS